MTAFHREALSTAYSVSSFFYLLPLLVSEDYLGPALSLSQPRKS